MPQIWLTYDELADFTGVATDGGRSYAFDRHLDRRRCSDGCTRVKLPFDMIDDYLVHALVGRNLEYEAPTRSSSTHRAASPFDRLADGMVDRLRRMAASG